MLIAVAIAAFVASATGVAWFRRVAERRRLLDHPNERSSHLRPTPRGGGVVIVACTLLILGAVEVMRPAIARSELVALLFAGALIAGISWIDDVRSLRASVRLAVHIVAAAIVMSAFGPFDSIPVPIAGDVHLGAAAWPLTIIWIVGLTNAYNFMDGIDGIAGSQAVVAGAAWAMIGFAGDPAVTFAAAVLASSSLGFLIHNWPPARIFMGDVGSAFLGFLFATLPLMSRLPSSDAAAIGFLVVWPFIFDTAFTFLRRLRRRERVFSAHRSHLYQRLVIAGWSHQTVTLLYSAIAALGAAAAIAIPRKHIAVLGAVALGLGLWLLVVAVESRTRTVPFRA